MTDVAMDRAQAIRHAALAQAVEVVRNELGEAAFYDTEPPGYPRSAADVAELERRALVDEAATIERVLRIARRLAVYIESGVTDAAPDAYRLSGHERGQPGTGSALQAGAADLYVLAPLDTHRDPPAHQFHVRAGTGRQGRLTDELRRGLVDHLRDGQAERRPRELRQQVSPAPCQRPDLRYRRGFAVRVGP